MTNRFKRAFSEEELDKYARNFDEFDPEYRVRDELRRCYALLEKAEPMAEFYYSEVSKINTEPEYTYDLCEDAGHKAREFLKELEK